MSRSIPLVPVQRSTDGQRWSTPLTVKDVEALFLELQARYQAEAYSRYRLALDANLADPQGAPLDDYMKEFLSGPHEMRNRAAAEAAGRVERIVQLIEGGTVAEIDLSQSVTLYLRMPRESGARELRRETPAAFFPEVTENLTRRVRRIAGAASGRPRTRSTGWHLRSGCARRARSSMSESCTAARPTATPAGTSTPAATACACRSRSARGRLRCITVARCAPSA